MDKAKMTLNAISNYIDANGAIPTPRELSEITGISINSIRTKLKELDKVKKLSYKKGKILKVGENRKSLNDWLLVKLIK